MCRSQVLNVLTLFGAAIRQVMKYGTFLHRSAFNKAAQPRSRACYRKL